MNLMKELRTARSHTFGVKHVTVLIGYQRTACILSSMREIGSFTETLELTVKLLHALLMVSQNQTTSISIELH
jgi:hypothetical protein